MIFSTPLTITLHLTYGELRMLRAATRYYADKKAKSLPRLSRDTPLHATTDYQVRALRTALTQLETKIEGETA